MFVILTIHGSKSGNKKDPVAFRWNERYKVAVGIAEALEYLHDNAPQTVIHRDVKSSNILLSDDFEPQVSFLQFLFFISKREKSLDTKTGNLVHSFLILGLQSGHRYLQRRLYAPMLLALLGKGKKKIKCC